MRAQERRIEGPRALPAAVDLPARERGSINAEAFLTVEDVRENGTQGCMVGCRVYSGSARAVRSLHEPFDFPLCHHFAVQFVQPAASRESL